MRMYDIIAHKRDGLALSDEEIAYFVRGFTDGDIDDSLAAALLMAIYLNGMDERETVSLTMEMARSGDMLNLNDDKGLTVDKHSTGGVGDKTTLIVAPIVASLGAKVAKMSGRGLGHTGGTIDKLEAIPGFRTSLSPDEFKTQIDTIGLAVVGQTGKLAPADKKIYSLRDNIATVACLPLIASSIMSKKLAAGSRSIVLDVKTGSGAFMKTPAEALELAKAMVKIGKSAGRRVSALVTNMDVPLGFSIGNSLEIQECVSVLKNESHGDLYEISIELAAQMLSLATEIDVDEARKKCVASVEQGTALEKLAEMVRSQGGDGSFIYNGNGLPQAEKSFEVVSVSDGYISEMNAEKIGEAALLLGAGRENPKSVIDHSAGIVLKKKTGDYVSSGEVISLLYTSTREFEDARAAFIEAVKISDERPVLKPLIYEKV